MTILVTDLGPNSAALNYSTKSTRFEILDGLVAWFANHGWTLHDDYANLDTATSPYKVMKAAQADATYVGEYLSTVNVSGGTATFVEAPLVTVGAPDVEGGTQATATAVLDVDGYVVSVTVDTAGSGYLEVPTVTIDGFDGTVTAELPTLDNEKFVQITVSDTRVHTYVYESWDAETHTGTNMGHHSDNTNLAQKLTLTYGGYLYMFATTRWMVIQSKQNDGDLGSATHGGFCGCLEISRDNPDEKVGKWPLFAFESAYQVDGYSADNTSYRDYLYCVGLPRDPFEQTAADASRYTYISTLFGCTFHYDHRLLYFVPVAVDPIGEKEEYFVMSLFVGHTGTGDNTRRHIRGRFYGLKMLTRYIGSFMDKISIPVDSASMYDPDGTPTDHFILTDDQGGRFAIPA